MTVVFIAVTPVCKYPGVCERFLSFVHRRFVSIIHWIPELDFCVQMHWLLGDIFCAHAHWFETVPLQTYAYAGESARMNLKLSVLCS